MKGIDGAMIVEHSSGNVFADMGLEDADGLMIRTRLGHAVRMILKQKKRKLREICNALWWVMYLCLQEPHFGSTGIYTDLDGVMRDFIEELRQI